MAFAITNIGIGNNNSGATVAATVGAGGVPQGCIVVVQVADASVSVLGGSVADSQTNTYTAITNVGADHNALTTNGFGRAFHSLNLATALVNTNTITYTKAITGSAASISACYVTGADTSGEDTAVSTTATGSSTTPSVTSGTPTVSGELFFGISSMPAAGTVYTQDAAWTAPPNAETTVPVLIGGNLTNAGTGTKTYAPTLDKSKPWMAAVFAYKPAGSGTGIAGSAYNVLPDNLPKKPRYDEQVNSTFFFPAAIGIGPIRNWYTADDLPRKPLYREQPQPFFFVVAKRFDGIPAFQPPDPKQVKPRYDEQPQPFFLVPIQRFQGVPSFQPPDPKQVKPRYDEQPQAFFLQPIRRFEGIPSFQPPDPLPRKPRYDEQIVRGWQLPIIRPTHGWDFQPDILPRPLKIVDYRPMFFRIRLPQTFATINI